MPLYDAGNRLKVDACETTARGKAVDRHIDYSVMNHRSSCFDKEDKEARSEFEAANRNLIAWEGYGGINGCTVVGDSMYRNDPDAITRWRERNQLPSRAEVIPRHGVARAREQNTKRRRHFIHSRM